MGNSRQKILQAIHLIEKKIGGIIRQSHLYQTAAWGKTDQPDFLNQGLMAETQLSPRECLRRIFSIEKKMGRIRTEKNAPRIIDIDILFFNDEVINEPGLIVPHPQIPNRKFVLVPMNEISPELVHPLLHQTINNLLSTCADPLEVRLLSRQ